MELGGVGRGLVVVLGFPCFEVGRDLAATAAKLSLPLKRSLPRGLGISTEAVRPAKAMAMLEVALVVGAMIR